MHESESTPTEIARFWSKVDRSAGTLLGNEHPDEHTYRRMHQRWELGIGK
jgi:hypothetical protein